MTIWHTLDWLPGYSISENGEIYSVLRGRVLKASTQTNGYRQIELVRADGCRKALLVHRLVAEAWRGPPPFKNAHCAHGDGVRTNNHWTNLRWATAHENAADRLAHGTLGRVLTAESVRQIREAYTGIRGQQKQLAADFGVSACLIHHIVSGKGWRGVAGAA